MADGGKPPSGFDSAVDFVLNMEGGQYVENDAGKGPSRWGILQIANPNVDVKNLSKEDAKKIYKAKFWDAINGDQLSSQNPGLALATFDAAVNHGVPTAKNMLASSQGDVGNLLQQRSNLYKDLINKDPQTYAKYGPGWDNRLSNLSAKISTAVPTSGLTGDALAKARAGVIPGGNLVVDGKRYSYEGKPIEEYKEPSIGQKAVGTGETALSLLTGLAAVPMAGALQAKDVIGYGLDRLMGRPGQEPTETGFAKNVARYTYSPRTEAGQDILKETTDVLGKLPPYIGGVGIPARTAQAAAVARRAEQAATEAAAARGSVAAPRLASPSVGAMSEAEIAAAKQKVETPRLPVPGATPEQQATALAALKEDQAAAAAARRNPTEVRQAQEAQQTALERLKQDQANAAAQTLKATDLAQESARKGVTAERMAADAAYAEQVAGRTGAAGVASSAADAAQAAVQPKPPAATAALTAPVPTNLTDAEKDKVIDAAQKAGGDIPQKEGWTNDDWLNFGFALLANRSPYFMEAFGTAGLRTLAAKQEQEKLKIEKELRSAQVDKLRAESEYLKNEKVKESLRKRAIDLAKAEISAMKSNMQVSTMMSPEDEQNLFNQVYMKNYNMLASQQGLAEAPTTMPTMTAQANRPPLSSFQK